jgi:Multiubiquitin
MVQFGKELIMTDKKQYKFKVDNKQFERAEPLITKAQIKALVNAPSAYGVWYVVPGHADDEELADEVPFDLSKFPGEEKFITGPKQTTEGHYELSA